MITIKNRQKKIPINIKRLESDIQKMLDVAGYSDFDVGVWLTTNATICGYNKKYRKKNKATDILSFPYHEIKAGQKIKVKEPEDKNLGDILISLEYAKKDCAKWGHSFSYHLHVLFAHGIAHLLGYNHKTEKEHQIMQKKEQLLLGALTSKSL